MLRMDEFNKIRKEFFINKKSVYEIAQKYNRSWDTINKVIKIPEHQIELRGKRNKKTIVITPNVLARVNEFLEFEQANKVPKKQRFTSKFIYQKLKEECNYTGSEKRVRTIVASARKEFKASRQETYLNLEFELGHYLQVDHGEVELIINNRKLLIIFLSPLFLELF